MKQPQLLTLQKMFDALSKENHIPALSFFKDGLGIVVNMNQFVQPFIHDSASPYLLDDYRVGYIKQGTLRSIINLQEHTLTAGHAVFVTPGTIVEPISVSDDFLIVGMGISNDLFHIAHSSHLPILFGGKQKIGILAVTPSEEILLDHLFRMLCELVVSQNCVTDASYHMIATITSYYNTLFDRQTKSAMTAHSTAYDIFERFIQLVNLHCREQRNLSFYADHLCLTERYLGTVVRQTSGITAKAWIDKAVTTAAKVMLRHGNLQIAEIAYKLHFANPSFFCKYFKRLTGFSPQEYRQG